MKMFSDEDHDPMKDYEFSFMHHDDDNYYYPNIIRGRNYDEDDEELLNKDEN